MLTERDWRWSFSYNLKQLLEEREMTQAKFAELMGLTEVCISWYINANRTPSIATLLKMCDVLDCGMEDLVC